MSSGPLHHHNPGVVNHLDLQAIIDRKLHKPGVYVGLDEAPAAVAEEIAQ